MSALTGNTIQDRIALLSREERRKAIETLLRKNGAKSEEQPIPRLEIRDMTPLSYAQERLWFLDQLRPGETAYNIPLAVRLRGELDDEALRSALEGLVRRHETLRTSFPSEGGRPVQRIEPADRVHVALPVVELEGSTGERKRESARLAIEEATGSFDLSRGPLLRAQLLRLGSEDHMLLLTLHHIASDGWSMGVLVRELAVLYEAAHLGQDAQLPELTVQYADYAVWQRQWLQGDVLEEQLSYWRGQLEGIALLELPTDRQRPAMPTYLGGNWNYELNRDVVTQLRALGQQEGVTLFMLLLAGFQVLLSRYSGQSDIAVGTAIANRTRREVEGMIGFFVNTLVLRTEVDGQMSFRQLAARVREVTLGAYAHQDLPFERLVDELRPERDLAYTPLFQVSFALQNLPTSELRAAGLHLQVERVEIGRAKFDLSVSLRELDDGSVAGSIEYSKDLFDAGTIERMAGHYAQLIRGLVAEPDLAVSSVSMLRADEQRQLAGWNRTEVDYGPSRCVHELIEEQSALRPKAEAVVFADERLTYSELNVQANRLAHRLRSLGVGPETRVGVCVERSPEMIVGLLAILKAGGAYVPLDPSYPSERMAYMLDDASPLVVLIQHSLLETLPPGSPYMLIDDMKAFASESTENLQPIASPANAAYVIYTSGSTGRPKGVLVSHQNLFNLVKALSEVWEIASRRRILQFASLSFDASVAEIFPGLASGSLLVLASKDELLDRSRLEVVVLRNSIDMATIPPSALAYMDPTALKPVRTLVVAGEPCPEGVIDTWSSGRQMINAYGPTECTVCTTFDNCSTSHILNSIGKPLSNIAVYVLDSNLGLVPVGIQGELYISGESVARGYINQADLTAAAFLPDPYSAALGARMYRTGDRVRRHPDGRLEYVGRIDRQLKVRGFRIEPGEIEAVLNRHPSVTQSAVMVQRTSSGQEHLVAYIIPDRSVRADLLSVPETQFEWWPSVAEYFVYDEILYHAMTADKRRNAAYLSALKETVIGKTVVDIGTGKDLTLARLSLLAGAKRVYAIEKLESSFREASNLAKKLGIEDRCIVIHGDARDISLPEAVDCCVSELVGPIGGCEGAALILNHAHRFLVPGGHMIPRRSVTKIAAVSLPTQILNKPAFSRQSRLYVDKIFEQIGSSFDLRVCIKGCSKENFVSDAGIFEDLDFERSIETAGTRSIELEIVQDGTVCGFLVWLTLRLGASADIDIMDGEYCWLPVYLPVFSEPVHVRQGDHVSLLCRHELSDNGLNPDYHISGQLFRNHAADLSFQFSSFHHQGAFQGNEFYRQLFTNSTFAGDSTTSTSELKADIRRYASSKLPHFMVPADIVIANTFPLTQNGKIDWLKLPELGRNVSRRTDAVLLDELEDLVFAFFRDLLPVQDIQVADTFFELGGNSLLAVQLASRVREACGVELAVADILQRATVRDIASAIRDRLQDGLIRRRPDLVPRTDLKNYPLSFSQQRLWFLDQLGQGSAYFVQLGLRIEGKLDVGHLQQSVNLLIRRHAILRTRFEIVDSVPSQTVDPDVQLSIGLKDWSDVPVGHRDRLLAEAFDEESQKGFNLSCAPLLRALLIAFGRTEHVLVLSLHHILVDAWSMPILMRDLTELYLSSVNGMTPNLPELPVQYSDYAVWQRDCVAGDLIDSALDYWRKNLYGSPRLLLPGEKHPDEELRDTKGEVKIVIPHESYAGLKELSRRSDATLSMVLTSLLGVALWSTTGQEDIVIGANSGTRPHPDLEQLAGFFVNLLVLRLDLSRDPPFDEVLVRVRACMLRAYSFQDIPFEILTQNIPSLRSSTGLSSIRAIINYQAPQMNREISVPGLKIDFLNAAASSPKVDWVINLADSGDSVAGSLEYRNKLFDQRAIARFIEQFNLLIAEVTESPNSSVSSLKSACLDSQVLSSAQRHQQYLKERRRMLAAYSPSA